MMHGLTDLKFKIIVALVNGSDVFHLYKTAIIWLHISEVQKRKLHTCNLHTVTIV